MSYHILIDRRTARVVEIEGRDREVTIFLHRAGRSGDRPESLYERLNEPTSRFLPCEYEGRSQLLSLARVAYVELRETGREVEEMKEMGAHQEPVCLVLVSQENLAGTLIYAAPPSRRRVSDLLNTTPDRFLCLSCGGDVTRYVQLAAISRVVL